MALDQNHISHLREMDRLLRLVYNNGKNRIGFGELFSDPQKPEDGLSFLFTPEIQKQAIHYLADKGYVDVEIGTGYSEYSLTFKGILKAFGSSFEGEYRRTDELNSLLKEVQETTLLKNKVSLVLSIVAVILSIIAIIE